jgi:hypothetical protein
MKKRGLALLCLAVVSSGCELMKSDVSSPSDLAPGATFPGGAARAGWPHTPDELIQFVAERYPQYLAGGVTLEQRMENITVLRERILEAGVCGGMDVARNLKRGVGPHSLDAICWRPDGITVHVVDFAADWDNAGSPIGLQWIIVSGPAGYDPIGHPACE